jgi:hypothetical protein
MPSSASQEIGQMDKELLRIRDLSLAAFALMKGKKLVDIEWKGPKRCVFLFDGDPSLFEEFFQSEIPKHAEFIKILKQKLQEVEKENGHG